MIGIPDKRRLSLFLARYTLILTIGLILLTSCVSRKKVVYFSGEMTETTDSRPSLIIEVGDIVDINVFGSDPDISKPFNQSPEVQQGYHVTTYESGTPIRLGYLVHNDSTVSLPVVGRVKLAGMYYDQAMRHLEEVYKNYFEQPQVSLNIVNFKITVLGEVVNPGTFNVPNQRITVVEALGVAGDLKITARRDNILVIRHENGQKKTYRLDLTKMDVVNSPAYYLKQNDIVYVEPSSKSRYEASILRSAGGALISITSLIVSTVILITSK